MKKGQTILAIVAAPLESGCARDRTESEEHLNQMWRQGYGYNNPNVTRSRNGQPPVDFDR